MKKSLKILKYAICFVLIFVVLFELTVLGVKIFGGESAVSKLPFYIWEIESDSMYPRLKRGDCILGADIPFEKLKTGDIITYAVSGEWVTHEVISVNSDATVTTKGLSNSYADGKISKNEYVGRMLIKLPILSSFMRLTETVWGKVIWILLVLLLCFGYPLGMRLTEKIKFKQKK